jgi:hypothetical protein
VTVKEKIAFTIVGESESGNALYLPQGVSVTDEALLEGVGAADGDDRPVTVTVKDVGGLDRGDPQPVGTPTEPEPYIINLRGDVPRRGRVLHGHAGRFCDAACYAAGGRPDWEYYGIYSESSNIIMGFVETFVKEGFTYTAMVGSRRHVMICELLSDDSGS